MVHEPGDDVVRLHEKIMNDMDRRIQTLEKSINKIPWILLIAAINMMLNLVIIIIKRV